MTTKTKGANYPPNLLSRREDTRKKGQCQLCRAKVDLKDQYTVENDLKAQTVTKKKNAARKGAEKMSHYCGDCATKRVDQKKAWMKSIHGLTAENGDSDAASKPKAKKATVKKAAAKAKATVAKTASKPKATGPKRVVKTPAPAAPAKEKVSGDTEPF